MKQMHLLISIAGILVGCSTSTLKPIERPQARVRVSGFEFLPPQGADWLQDMGAPQNVISYLKQLPEVPKESRIHTVFFAVQSGRFDRPERAAKDLIKEAEASKVAHLKSHRFKLIRSKFIPSDYSNAGVNAKCLRYDSEAEDLQVPERSTYPYFIRQTGLFCLHPDRTGRFVDVSFSQRFVSVRQPLDLTKEGETFVNSLKFLFLPWDMIAFARERASKPEHLRLAQEVLQTALKTAEAEKDDYTASVILGELGISYMRGKVDVKKAEDFYNRAIKKNRDKGYRYLLSENFYNLANVYRSRKQGKLACETLQKAKPLILDLRRRPVPVPEGAAAEQVENIAQAVSGFASEIRCPIARIEKGP